MFPFFSRVLQPKSNWEQNVCKFFLFYFIYLFIYFFESGEGSFVIFYGKKQRWRIKANHNDKKNKNK